MSWVVSRVISVCAKIVTGTLKIAKGTFEEFSEGMVLNSQCEKVSVKSTVWILGFDSREKIVGLQRRILNSL